MRWYRRVGDHVHKGQSLAEIEAEKVNVEVEAPEDGILEAILVPADSVIRGEVVLARLTPRAFDPSARPAPVAELRSASAVEPRVRLPDGTAHAQRRCGFCKALEMSGRVECARCGAPL